MEQENRERLIKLETHAHYERQRVDFHLTGLHHRIAKLETVPTVSQRVEKVLTSSAGWSLIKFLLALAVTLLAFLASGDPHVLLNVIKAKLGVM